MHGAKPKGRWRSQAGLTLVELMVGGFLMVIVVTMLNRLIGDQMLTAKTLNVSSESNLEMMRLLRSVRTNFQKALPQVTAGELRESRERGCILTRTGADENNIGSYSCTFESAGQPSAIVKSAGIGFKLDTANPPKPAIAFVNACETIPEKMTYPQGRARLSVPPEDLSQMKNWGSLDRVCPAACPANQRPAVRLLKAGGGATAAEQYPRAISGPSDSSALHLWGVVLCASYFKDNVRQLQHLYGDNVGGFLPNYLSISAFVARGRFDIKVPAGRSLYVWNHGGDLLEFNASQELSTFKCNAGQPGCGASN